MAALGVVAGTWLVAVPHVAADGTAYVVSDVQCDQAGRGVLDLTLVNDSDTADAEFVVGGTPPAASTVVVVAPTSAHTMTFTDLADGDVSVPIRIDGTPSDVVATVQCELPRVEALSGTAHIVSGVTPELPRTGSSTAGLLIGGALVSAGIAASLIARRRYS